MSSENMSTSCNISVLEFQVEMFNDVLNEDCLVVASRGILLENLVVQLMKAYNSPENLILVIGSSPAEEDYVMNKFKDEDLEGMTSKQLPRQITSEYSAGERAKIYLNGGILFVTTRILVVDMLMNRIPFHLISGMLVLKAHNIVDNCQEAFILRLFRMNNKTGFVKAFSNSPSALSQGFAKADRVMRYLFVTKLFLWPRFHASINGSLDSRAKADVIEIRLKLSHHMEMIQFALMDLITTCLKEMAKCNVSLIADIDCMTAENAISPGFDKHLRQQFDPVWHQLSGKTKRLINDLKVLRQLLFLLTAEDCVSFYRTVQAIRQNVKLDTHVPEWFYWEPVETLFISAKERLFDLSSDEIQCNLEINQKWRAFCEVVKEVKEESKKDGKNGSVAVVVKEDRTIRKLKDVLELGPEAVINDIYERNVEVLSELFYNEGLSSKATKKREPLKKKRDSDEKTLTLTQMMKNYDDVEKDLESSTEFNVLYHPLSDGAYKFEELLKTHQPVYFVLYDPDMQTIRQIEMYQALKCSPNRAKVYFFLYEGSSEEQQYLTSLKKEKTAFEALIREKATMVIPAERDGKCDHHPDLIRASTAEATSSRQAGGQLINRRNMIKQKIIVDVREFRSILPSLVHKRGIDIEPIMIEIGDYILTPETCVERKSVSDLIGSLNNGRLYNQCKIMTRHYKRAIILIEFDQNKSFSFKGKYWGLGRRLEPGEHDVVAKLILLTLHFSQVRLIWSPSPHFSAEVFEYLKVDKEQPDGGEALAVGDEELPAEHNLDKYDIAAKDFLLNLPGINLYNVYAVMNKAASVEDLCKRSLDELIEILGNTVNAKALFECLHLNLVVNCVNDQLQLEDKRKGRSTKKLKTTK